MSCSLDQVSHCSECDSSGPNLWLCLHRGCYKVGCGEAHNDHSTLHNRVGTDKCVLVIITLFSKYTHS
jgi:uncharacterized UBP type Zn finger protein